VLGPVSAHFVVVIIGTTSLTSSGGCRGLLDSAPVAGRSHRNCRPVGLAGAQHAMSRTFQPWAAVYRALNRILPKSPFHDWSPPPGLCQWHRAPWADRPAHRPRRGVPGVDRHGPGAARGPVVRGPAM